MKMRGEGSLYISWQLYGDPEMMNSVDALRFRHIKIDKFSNFVFFVTVGIVIGLGTFFFLVI